MKKHLDKYDKDSNQKVTRNEIAERIQVWTSSQLALLGATFSIRLDGRPLDGATVTLIPESYLGPDVKSASGVTNSVGLTRASHAEEDLPKTASGRPLYGVKAGTYKIQITHPSRKIPAKYNTATEIGEEIAPDINPTQAPIRLSLTSQ
jgi:hypothetical protein